MQYVGFQFSDPGIKPVHPALGLWSQSMDYQRSPENKFCRRFMFVIISIICFDIAVKIKHSHGTVKQGLLRVGGAETVP